MPSIPSSETLSFDIQSLLEAALNGYQKRTGTRLFEHQLSSKLESCGSAESVLVILQEQAQAFQNHRGDDGRVMKWIKRTVYVLYTLSTNEILGHSVDVVSVLFPPARAIFAGIGILFAAIKDVNASYDALVDLFEFSEHFLGRLEIYLNVPPEPAMTEILVKILVELLAVLALATQQVKQGRLIKFGRKLFGEKDVEMLLQRLDRLMLDESRMISALTLEAVHCLLRCLNESDESSAHHIQLIHVLLRNDMMRQERDQLRKKSRRWLSPRDPSIIYNCVFEAHHSMATWFIEGATFLEWKTRGSLLWIHGKLGSGKTVLCCAIIRDLETMRARTPRRTSTAFFFFDSEDKKQGRRDLLASLLIQISSQSDHCFDILSRLYTTHDGGLRQPSDRALLDCLKEMLTAGKLGPTYIIVDALDECPRTFGTPSTREKVLDLVTGLAHLNLPNLHLCVTSRHETDIRAVLEPLVSCSVSLHDEAGQREEIQHYISSIVDSDTNTNQWNEEDKNLVVNTLRQEANGMFQWVYCQLDRLRRCNPGDIQRTLKELPRTLDDTYERALQGIDEEKWSTAHRLFQFITVARRPLHGIELGEIFAFDFTTGTSTTYRPAWRPKNPSDAVLSTCSSLITAVTMEPSSVFQFSHPSVKDFLMSSRLANSPVSRYYISPELAHRTVARACLSVLLQPINSINETGIKDYPFASYAAQYWVEHAKFENVSPPLEGAMKCLFDPDRPHFSAWLELHDMDRDLRESKVSGAFLQPQAPPIYYATLCNFPNVVEWLITARSQSVNARGGCYGTSLCAAVQLGCLETARVLVKHGAHVDVDGGDGPPLMLAADNGHVELAQLLLDHRADINFQSTADQTPLFLASERGHLEIARLLLQRGAKANFWGPGQGTPLYRALQKGHQELAQLLLDHGADVNAQNAHNFSLLHLASRNGNLEPARWLLKNGANIYAEDKRGWTPFQEAKKRQAKSKSHRDIARLLSDQARRTRRP